MVLVRKCTGGNYKTFTKKWTIVLVKQYFKCTRHRPGLKNIFHTLEQSMNSMPCLPSISKGTLTFGLWLVHNVHYSNYTTAKRSATQVTLIFLIQKRRMLVDLISIFKVLLVFLHSHLEDVGTCATLGSTRENT